MVINNSLIDLETLLAEDQVEETEVASVEETEVASVEETEVASVEESEVASVEKTEVASVEETEVASVEETEVTSVEEIELVYKEYDGVTYYLDEKTNELYNEMEKLVGLWDVENENPIYYQPLGVSGFEDWKLIPHEQNNHYYFNFESGESQWFNPSTGIR